MIKKFMMGALSACILTGSVGGGLTTAYAEDNIENNTMSFTKTVSGETQDEYFDYILTIPGLALDSGTRFNVARPFVMGSHGFMTGYGKEALNTLLDDDKNILTKDYLINQLKYWLQLTVPAHTEPYRDDKTVESAISQIEKMNVADAGVLGVFLFSPYLTDEMNDTDENFMSNVLASFDEYDKHTNHTFSSEIEHLKTVLQNVLDARKDSKLSWLDDITVGGKDFEEIGISDLLFNTFNDLGITPNDIHLSHIMGHDFGVFGLECGFTDTGFTELGYWANEEHSYSELKQLIYDEYSKYLEHYGYSELLDYVVSDSDSIYPVIRIKAGETISFPNAKTHINQVPYMYSSEVEVQGHDLDHYADSTFSMTYPTREQALENYNKKLAELNAKADEIKSKTPEQAFDDLCVNNMGYQRLLAIRNMYKTYEDIVGVKPESVIGHFLTEALEYNSNYSGDNALSGNYGPFALYWPKFTENKVPHLYDERQGSSIQVNVVAGDDPYAKGGNLLLNNLNSIRNFYSEYKYHWIKNWDVEKKKQLQQVEADKEAAKRAYDSNIKSINNAERVKEINKERYGDWVDFGKDWQIPIILTEKRYDTEITHNRSVVVNDPFFMAYREYGGENEWIDMFEAYEKKLTFPMEFLTSKLTTMNIYPGGDSEVVDESSESENKSTEETVDSNKETEVTKETPSRQDVKSENKSEIKVLDNNIKQSDTKEIVSPNTGDSMNPVWIVLAVGSGATALALVLSKKFRRAGK